jgi:hypothetical protein
MRTWFATFRAALGGDKDSLEALGRVVVLVAAMSAAITYVSEAEQRRFEQSDKAWSALLAYAREEANPNSKFIRNSGHIGAVQFLASRNIPMNGITLPYSELGRLDVSPGAATWVAGVIFEPLLRSTVLGAHLSSSNFRCSNLTLADLRMADLRHADLSGSTLDYADLRMARLDQAGLQNTILNGTLFEGASYRVGVTADAQPRYNIAAEQFNGACYVSAPPEGLPSEIADRIPQCTEAQTKRQNC